MEKNDRRRYDFNRNLGNHDAVTDLLKTENNPSFRRKAMYEGWDLLFAGNPANLGKGADQQAAGMNRRHAGRAEEEIQDSLRRVDGSKIVLSQVQHYLGQNYAPHPEMPKDLNVRVFGYDQKMDAVTLDVPSTLKILSQLSVAANPGIESLLEAEMELPSKASQKPDAPKDALQTNAQVLRQVQQWYENTLKNKGGIIVRF